MRGSRIIRRVFDLGGLVSMALSQMKPPTEAKPEQRQVAGTLYPVSDVDKNFFKYLMRRFSDELAQGLIHTKQSDDSVVWQIRLFFYFADRRYDTRELKAEYEWRKYGLPYLNPNSHNQQNAIKNS